MQTWWVYMVRCTDGSLYTGITMDVKKRFREHQDGGNRGAKYLRGRGPLLLVFRRKIGEKGLALKVEMQIKKLKKDKKETLVRDQTLIRSLIRDITHQEKNNNT